MAWKLTLEEINSYKAAFSLFDKELDGKISSDDMGVLMRSLGQNFSSKDFNKITDDIGKESVELHEFLNIMAENRKTSEDQLELIRAFKYFDRENIGTIDFEEFKHALTTVSEKLSNEETEALINLAKLDSNGRLVYKDMAQQMILK